MYIQVLITRYAVSAVIATVVLLMTTDLYASGPRHDSDENYSDIPGAHECWVDGWDDGANDDYDRDRARECYDKGDQYNRAFPHGQKCLDPEEAKGIEDDCENARED
jgi:hypothetical protein